MQTMQAQLSYIQNLLAIALFTLIIFLFLFFIKLTGTNSVSAGNFLGLPMLALFALVSFILKKKITGDCTIYAGKLLFFVLVRLLFFMFLYTKLIGDCTVCANKFFFFLTKLISTCNILP